LEDGLDPFDGNVLSTHKSDSEDIGEDFDMEMAIEDIEEDPPPLFVKEGEE
jgi:hypothetical protein